MIGTDFGITYAHYSITFLKTFGNLRKIQYRLYNKKDNTSAWRNDVNSIWISFFWPTPAFAFVRTHPNLGVVVSHGHDLAIAN